LQLHSPQTDVDTDDGNSYLEEPPETPAPLFAVRAFKTAIFGTPHPIQDGDLNNEKRPAQGRALQAKELVPQHQPPDGTAPSLGHNTEPNHKPKVEPLASPAKGILLTPGTAVTKRKTVSFGGLASNTADKTKRKLDEINTNDNFSKDGQRLLTTETLRSEPKNQSSLTKILFKAQLEASKKRLNNEAAQEKSRARAVLLTRKDGSEVGTTSEEEVSDPAGDTTVDLSQPCSRSGQHWKAEYELYHKNSAREIKKIIKYGQNAKSYALKKDFEATNLGEKLKQELSKLAAMEAKVSKLATQLTNARHSGSDGDADQIKLMSDLAKQTALAIRYKQKADVYRKAIETNNSADVHVSNRDESYVELNGNKLSSKRLAKTIELDEAPPELVSLRTELEALREKAKSTEEKAARLEAENMTLKRNLARVKEEMNSYEKRRLTREQRLKNRETRLQQEKQEYERRLAETIHEYQRLLRRPGECSKDLGAEIPISKHNGSNGDAMRHLDLGFREEDVVLKQVGPSDAGYRNPTSKSLKGQGNQNSASPKPCTVHERQLLSSPRDMVVASPNAARSETPELPKQDHKQTAHMCDTDMWMMGSPENASLDTLSFKGLAQSSHFDLLRKETNHALQELDQNSVTELPINNQVPFHQLENSAYDTSFSPSSPKIDSSVVSALPSCEPSMSSAVRRMHERRLNISSPRPSIVSFDNSPPQQASSSSTIQPANASDGRNSLVAGPREQMCSSIMSSSTRTSPMASVRRHPALPPDRAAAAKARLQRRSMEKQKLRERNKENARP